MHKKRQDNGSRNAGESYVNRVQVNGRRDHGIASERIGQGRIIGQRGYYAHGCRFTGVVVLEMLESTIQKNVP